TPSRAWIASAKRDTSSLSTSAITIRTGCCAPAPSPPDTAPPSPPVAAPALVTPPPPSFLSLLLPALFPYHSCFLITLHHSALQSNAPKKSQPLSAAAASHREGAAESKNLLSACIATARSRDLSTSTEIGRIP